MRYILYAIWVLLVVLGVSFAVLNSHDVQINYFVGDKTLYFPFIMLIILVLGALLGVLALLPSFIRLKVHGYELKRKIKSLEKESAALSSIKEEMTDA
ncbi:MAG TPA: lipopolysaccharide assembly protein LapA domain-containing protein [Coxiellaceae bacterium]|nr:lipopolysaccharide assembly protein LapA domain-containing protein [Coxiellaceae bacterium]